MTRHSFIQMSKLTNVRGRISYISSYARQENLYAVYETIERKFWGKLADCNQEEFLKYGTEGKCIEARELIIALPEGFTEYEPQNLLKLFVEHFKQQYMVECIAALHHNKPKTNYHVHLIFSERKPLEKPVEKIANRNMFYDETGKHVRTKKEILDNVGQVRSGCKIIPKGEVYERKLFEAKDKKFKSESFLDEVKRSYTELINLYVKDSEERLQVFNKGSVYLPMKKVGKHNPKAAELRSDNQVRQNWNQTVDRALISGVSEVQIIKIKQVEISDRVRDSVKRFGRQPNLFEAIVLLAITALQLLITQIFQKVAERIELSEKQPPMVSVKASMGEFNLQKEVASGEHKTLTEPPEMSVLASRYSELSGIYQKLRNENYEIHKKEDQLSELEKELDNAKGIFKGKQRKELQEQISEYKIQVDNMKGNLSNIVQKHGYKDIKGFVTAYQASEKAYYGYKKEVSDRQYHTKRKAESESIKARLDYQKQKLKERENSKQHKHSRSRSRDAR